MGSYTAANDIRNTFVSRGGGGSLEGGGGGGEEGC